jgi:hypothetical protein
VRGSERAKAKEAAAFARADSRARLPCHLSGCGASIATEAEAEAREGPAAHPRFSREGAEPRG